MELKEQSPQIPPASLEEQLIALRDWVAENTRLMRKMKTDFELTKERRGTIRCDFKEKVGRDELAVLEARVAKLERTGRGKT